MHPYYDDHTKQNDIAVLKTQQFITFSLDVGPVCLPFRYSSTSFTGASVTALGWGTLEFTGPKSNTLQGVNLTVISNKDCSLKATDQPIFDSQICTYTPHKDACQSDSGGPLLWMDPSTKRTQLLGAISYGMGCATEIPSVNTRVSSFLSWIVSVTPGEEYCIK